MIILSSMFLVSTRITKPKNYATFTSGPTLKQFILKAQVINFYREMMKTTKLIHNKNDKKELRKWIRQEFKIYKSETNTEKIKELLSRGKKEFKRISGLIMLSS
ncbi:hypothetical protein Glove_31g16 [Diversispora epigaea]|uniref:LYR motif-containing protein 2 n=1 Tax=Diversispora epigaea TaxID=1348612 RepID=A0A397JJE2_9GLOM|nr:hypothetical protein Glove_31g16 [Diversispora epigaea]